MKGAMKTRVIFGLLFLMLLAARLCHIQILWAEETLPLAAATQMLDGKVLYRDIWFDKPPLLPAIYLLWGARQGWALRVAGALYVLLACWLVYCFARDLWGEREGLLAACLLAFFLTFWIPAAVLPLAADLLMLAPHLAAVYLAWRGRAFWSGALAGVALLLNSKGFFVLLVCALWQWRALPLLGLGFALPNVVAFAWLALEGALPGYYLQVWRLGFLYSGATFLANPVGNGVVRTANWLGFHAAIVLGAAWFYWRDRTSERWRFAAWTGLSFVAVVLGWRFFPRYYFQLLPVAVLAGARGLSILERKRAIVLLALLVPLIRFGPRYALLADETISGHEREWRDTAMDQDSRAASQLVKDMAKPGDTLFVWGYRPEIYIYTRLPAASRFLESQPLTGVLADRHLVESTPLEASWIRANREELTRSHPTFILDGLAPYNPALSIERFDDLRPWLSHYRVAARTQNTIIYVSEPRP